MMNYLTRLLHGGMVCLVAGMMVQSVHGAATTAPAAPAQQIVLRQVTLNDPGTGNMPSHVLLAPKDWKVQGGGWWPNPQLFNILPSQDIKVTAPDGREVRIGPGIGAVETRLSPQAMQMGVRPNPDGSVEGGYPVLHMPENPGAWQTWLQQKILPQTYPEAKNIRVEKVEVIPELTAILQKQLEPMRRMQAQMNQQARQMGLPSFSFCDGSMLGATCTFEQGGQRWDLLLVFGTVYVGSDSQVGRQIWWTIEPNISFRTQAGRMEANMPLMMAICNSVHPTPQWAKMKADHIAKMHQIAAKGAADRSRIMADANREINKIRNDTWKARQASQDRSHHQFINAIREVEDYTTPGSNQSVQLPNNYQHVYTNGNNEYILTNSSLYDPNQDKAVNQHQWQTMQVAKP